MKHILNALPTNVKKFKIFSIKMEKLQSQIRVKMIRLAGDLSIVEGWIAELGLWWINVSLSMSNYKLSFVLGVPF